MKKVLVINGSARKGRTFELLKNIAEKLPYDVEYIHLKEYDIKDCLGCEVCKKKDFCVIKDQAEELMEKLKSADGIVLGTPVYIENVSGVLKKFLDRTCRWYHRPPLLGKPALLVATTAGSSLKKVLQYLEDVVTTWGMIPTGKIGKRVSEKRVVSKKQIKKFINAMEKPPKRYIRLTKLIRFQVQKAMATNLLDIDKNYWIEKGLNKKKLPLQILYRSFLILIFNFIWKIHFK
ncbi:iron-sulfur flavoprotein [Thermosipho africanus TCF52B]|uniref:Iron-sulfur flavoprotein n=1 Tax=Thermosipho africanus (strain TCF52B) TaxID=484019 RepID=B7IHH9_THEAB|nr:flavodoxin family protein [Thermosipho africanus]ACJ75543.1 iron-sulfur flavoprotein [Thermosipho africanus TCF52B]